MMRAMSATNQQRPARRLLDLHTVANELGCSVDTVDRYIRAGKLPVVRLPSGRRRVDREDLNRAIEEWKVASR
jgi:excisionase family DNA binding protein